jgi:predicted transcriptional regulator
MANKPKFTVSEFVRIVEKSDGTVAGIAEIAGVSEETVRNYRKRRKRVAKAMQQIALLRQEERRQEREAWRAEMLLLAEENLKMKLVEKDWSATKFTLETLGREEFSKRTEVTATMGILELSAEALEALRLLGIEPSAAVAEFEALVKARAAVMADNE